ncbi:hypothetical protein SUDANB171_02584 [Streptomyces sp. enrichment culture]|jgi:hypothetical protein
MRSDVALLPLDRLYPSTTPENTAMRQLMAGLGLTGVQGEFTL